MVGEVKTKPGFYDPKTKKPQLVGTMPPHRMKEVVESLKLVLEIE